MVRRWTWWLPGAVQLVGGAVMLCSGWLWYALLGLVTALSGCVLAYLCAPLRKVLRVRDERIVWWQRWLRNTAGAAPWGVFILVLALQDTALT